MEKRIRTLLRVAAEYQLLTADIFERLAFTENPGIMRLVEQQRESNARLKLAIDEAGQLIGETEGR